MSYHFIAAVALAALCAVGSPVTHAGQMDVGLADYLVDVDEHTVVSTLVYLRDRVDLEGLNADFGLARVSRHDRHRIVVESLQELAQWSQPDLIAAVQAMKNEGDVAEYQAFWISNMVRVDGTRDAIEAIAARPDVDWVYYNYAIELIDPVVEKHEGGIIQGTGPENGVNAVRAPEVWAMGIDGAGILVATLDTGVDGNHPALASRWRGLDPAYANNPEWAWFDPVTNSNFPIDSGNHGTHTMGSVLGGAPGNQVGVAPGAQFIHAAVIDRNGLQQTVDDAILAFQWMIDPDGDPGTSFDVPHVCSNSWGIVTWHDVPPFNAPCDDSFWGFLDACEAAGIVMLFAAGNEGSDANTLRRPGDRATDEYRNCAVGGISANDPPNWTIYSGSSRGPTFCTDSGAAAIKPDIAAPGVAVVSCVPFGGYAAMTGTSMATPHVNGVIALMRQACPDLGPDEIKQIIYDTAFDLGAPGKDNDYGYGLIDAYAAVNMAFSLCGASQPRAISASYEVPVNQSQMITLEALDHDGEPGGPLTSILTAGPTSGTLTDPTNGHLIGDGEFPYTLINNGDAVIYTPITGYYGGDAFAFAADDGGAPPEGGVGEPATVSLFVQFDSPAITTAALPDGNVGSSYGPVQLVVDGGQPPLVWTTTTASDYEEIDLGKNQFVPGGVARNWQADDESWSYTLPFSFEYYGEIYDSVWVCSNGFLDFTSDDSDGTNSTNELMSAVRICPLWDDMVTNHGDDDIYIDESVSGQVTIRWDATSLVFGLILPRNVACTLYADGRIRFHYGSDNGLTTPTVGISGGAGNGSLLSSYDGRFNLSDLDSQEFWAPPLLPEGLTLSEAGVISGVPTEIVVSSPRFTVTDSLGRVDMRQIDIEIFGQGCVADIDDDGFVGFADLLQVLTDWGTCSCASDLDNDGNVGFNDLLVLLAAWGPCP